MLNETEDFIGQEFEKDLVSHQKESMIDNCRNRKEISSLPKYTIIEKLIEMEIKSTIKTLH